MPTQLFDTRVNVFLGDTASPSPKAFVQKPSVWTLGTAPRPRASEMDSDRLRRPSSSPTGLKPLAEGTRNASPFGSPRRERQPERTRRDSEGDARSQVNPSPGGTDASVLRKGHWRESVTTPASGVHGRPGIAGLRPAADRASRGRLNGFPEAFAGVFRHHVGGGWRRLSDAAPTGFSDARFVVERASEPAYSLGPHSACPRARLAGGRAPSDPRTGNGAP